MDRLGNLLVVCVIASCILAPGAVFAQRFTSEGGANRPQSAGVSGDRNAEQAYLSLKAGILNDARKYLTGANPSDPFAVFVRAALTPDAAEAADMYKEIVAENPGTPIAREALLQLYKYHYAAGDYRDAHTDYLELRKLSPTMPQLVDPLGFEDTLHLPPTVAKPQASGIAAEPGQPSSGVLFTVQVGAFSTPENAQRFVSDLKNKGVSAAVFTKVDAGRTLYAVSAGTFSTREAAEAYAAELKGRSVNSIVVQR